MNAAAAETLAALAQWLPRQRWYASGGSHTPELRVLCEREWESADPDARIRHLVVADDTPRGPMVYHVPIVERGHAEPSSTVIGRDGDRVLIDAPHDQAYTTALLHRLDPARPAARSGVLRGEQSNTSIVFTPVSGDSSPVIAKLFRLLEPGTNPDVVVQEALVGAGCTVVPPVVGVISDDWEDPNDPARSLRGSLVFAQEFLENGADGWALARQAAGDGRDLSGQTRDIGVALAEVHRLLAQLFPTATATRAERARLVAQWQSRWEAAAAEVRELRPYHGALEEAYAAAGDDQWPALQSVHGDFHLGQLLSVPGRGWVILDFEGEPLRPMAERLAPDLALRDVAGMLRSIDYVAGSLAQAGTPVDPTWAPRARAGFLAGYAQGGMQPLPAHLLRALELDKAVYECVYEARHRPDWLQIPLAGIERLVMGGSRSAR